ncbi:AMIN domain-containing protein [Helicobacter winghamensis]|uniref:AMIN domain-containing protein n=1 Tax=Helicobacter winghamensis TaxID=157268 RepID=UPI00242F6126|nr:AMIN domain-containing protein [Helicobacter winghamensis]
MKSLALILTLTLTLLHAQTEPQNTLPEIPKLSIDSNNQNKEQTEQNINNTKKALPNETSTEPTGIMENLAPKELANAQESNATKKARDPFTPIITPKDSGQITNAPQLDLFTKTELILPSTARKIKKITLEYQNLNGSITTLEKELEGDIDWHFPLVLSQEVQPKTHNIPEKESFALEKYFNFEITKNSIALNTHLTLLRDFTLASPTRLILDFKAPSKKPLKASFTPKIPTIPQVSLDSHLDFYRITLNLDGQYKYNLVKDTKTGNYSIELY